MPCKLHFKPCRGRELVAPCHVQMHAPLDCMLDEIRNTGQKVQLRADRRFDDPHMTFMGFQEISRHFTGLPGPPTSRAILIALLILFALPLPVRSAAPEELVQWRSGLTELDEGWVRHDGDDMR